ncbi:inclusion body family protein [Streptomyces sp. XH2]|uniref:inclusion body family protein n=1 Tax=Streptomyces sp. XH2 TaxID=3412483 RepID=UPI003C7B2859
MTTEEEMPEVFPTPQNSQIIDVLVTFDAYTIVKNYPASTNPDRPTGISSSLIYMTTRQDRIIGYPGAELNLKANPLDVIRWRESTLSLNTEYSALLYRFVPKSGEELISPPGPLVAEVVVPYPMRKPPEYSFETQDIKGHHWGTTALATGTVVYEFYFQLIDGSGKRIGYYRWDPRITIVKRGQ